MTLTDNLWWPAFESMTLAQLSACCALLGSGLSYQYVSESIFMCPNYEIVTKDYSASLKKFL